MEIIGHRLSKAQDQALRDVVDRVSNSYIYEVEFKPNSVHFYFGVHSRNMIDSAGMMTLLRTLKREGHVGDCVEVMWFGADQRGRIMLWCSRGRQI